MSETPESAPPVGQDAPALDEVADEQDTLDWDRERDGLMADAATAPEDEPETQPFTPEG